MVAYKDLKTPTIEFLNIWCNEKNVEKGLTYLHQDMTAVHDDDAPRSLDNFIAGWKYIITSLAPEFKYDTKDIMQEGNKVWVYARISGLPNGEVKDTVDMLEWDEKGERLIRAKDVQRNIQQ